MMWEYNSGSIQEKRGSYFMKTKKRYSPFLQFRHFSLFGFILFFSFLTGCGKKAPPLPPESVVPEAVKAFKVEGKEEGLLLSWRIPERNNDGTPLVDLAGFKVYKKDEAKVCRDCPADFPAYLDIDMEAPEGVAVEGRKVYFLDSDVAEGGRTLYRVAPYNRPGYFGTFSEVVTARWSDPPPPPEGVEGTGGDRSVKLWWEPRPARGVDEVFSGYRIYRSQSSGEYPKEAVTGEPVAENSFTDIGLENNRHYYYTIRSVIKSGETLIEGHPSREVLVIPVDMIPPSVPHGLSLVPTDTGVALSWDVVADGDLAGYYIYRRPEGGFAAERINSAPVRENHYLDADVKRGKKYTYSVTSVDNSPQKNESAPSVEVSARIPID